MQSNPEIRLAIFDLGNVLFGISFEKVLKSWANSVGEELEAIKSRFSHDKAFEEFEYGRITPQEFHEAVKRSLDIEIAYADFEKGWNEVFCDPFERTISAIESIKSKVDVVAFTNTNEIHVKVFPDRYTEALSHFKRIYISSEMGKRKPDPDGFLHILADWKVQPTSAVFFDDSPPNVETAKRIGMNAYLVVDELSVENALRELRLI